jgi:endonuclease III related protein
MNAQAARLRAMHDALFAAYGPQHWWPAQPRPAQSRPARSRLAQSSFDARFEVIVGAYLTQNTSWKAVERSLDALRAEGALSVEGLRAISADDLTRIIRPSGFVTRKAPALKAFVALLDAEFSGSLNEMAAMAGASTDALRKRLLDLPGVGPETADAILLYALGAAVPVADEYLRRIAERHGLLPAPVAHNRRGYEALAALTQQAFALDPIQNQKKLFNEFHALTVAVGKAHCGSTPRCEGCPLRNDLIQHGIPPKAQKQIRAVGGAPGSLRGR